MQRTPIEVPGGGAVEPARGYWRRGLPHLRGSNITELPHVIAVRVEAGLTNR